VVAWSSRPVVPEGLFEASINKDKNNFFENIQEFEL